MRDIASQKRAAAYAAVAEVCDGMLVGIGTGSTVAFAIEALGRRRLEGLRITAVATSLRSEAAALAVGIPVLDFARVDTVDLCIDGVDEIDPQFRAIKGGGGAMLREKIVAAAAGRMIAIADAGKRVAQLGAVPLPLEVLPFARAFVSRRVAELGSVPTIRDAVTDQGNIIIDCAFGSIADTSALAAQLSAIPGVLGHGLFLEEIYVLYLGTETGVDKTVRFRLGHHLEGG